MDILKPFFERFPEAMNNISRNSEDANNIAKKYLERYAFVHNDIVYFDYMLSVNGFSFFCSDFSIVLYGFALHDEELIYEINEYITEEGFLAIGTYTDKRTNNWNGITYFYFFNNKEPWIYAKFYISNTLASDYKKLCKGFEELINILAVKNFDEQFMLSDQSI